MSSDVVGWEPLEPHKTSSIQLWFLSADQAGIPRALQGGQETHHQVLSGVRCDGGENDLMLWLDQLDTVGARPDVLLLPYAGVFASRSVWFPKMEPGPTTMRDRVDVDLPHGLWVQRGGPQLRDILLPHRPRLWQTLCRSLVVRLTVSPASPTPRERDLLRCTEWHRENALLLHANEKTAHGGRRRPKGRR